MITETMKFYILLPLAIVGFAASCYLFNDLRERDMAVAQAWCQPRGAVGAANSKYTGPMCIMPDGSYMKIPAEAWGQ